MRSSQSFFREELARFASSLVTTRVLLQVVLLSLFTNLPVQAKQPSGFQAHWSNIIDRALSSNAEICLALYDAQIARSEIAGGNVDFETLATFKPEYKHDRLLSNSTLESASYLDTTGALSLGLKKKYTAGTQAELVLQEMWLGSDSIQTTFHSRDQIALQVKLTQPLLKGRGSEYNEATSRKATAKAERYSNELDVTINDTLIKTLGLYLDFIRNKHDEKIKSEDEEYYQRRKTEAEARLRVGAMSEADALAIRARAQVARAERLLAAAKAMESEEQLARQITSPLNSSGSQNLGASLSGHVIPNYNELITPEEMAAGEGKITRIENHPTLRALAAKAAETEADFLKAKNSLLPQLDLSLQGSTVGAGQDHAGAEEGMTSRRTPSWQVMLTFSYPIENLVATGEYERLASERQTHSLSYHKKKIDLQADKTDLARILKSGRESLELARKRVEAAEFILTGKEQGFARGRISSSDLIQARLDFSETKSEAISTAIKLKKSLLNSQVIDHQMIAYSRKGSPPCNSRN